jgi:hypothetical protein
VISVAHAQRLSGRTNAFAVGISGSTRQQILFVTKFVLEINRSSTYLEGSIRRLPFVPSLGGLATLDATLWHFSDLALMVGSVRLLERMRT